MDDLMTTDACTLPTSDRPLRLAEFDALFVSSAHHVARRPLGVTIHLRGAPTLRAEVDDLAGRESSCCSFFTFTVSERDHDVVLDVAVPAERRDILDALAVRAEAAIALPCARARWPTLPA